jgi:predicted adenine nucleotide alpha hydrolase (AANH) superfamily ATPase
LSEFDWFSEEVGSAIRVLVEKFIEMPYFFYSEQDMHAYLYHKLISGKLGELFVETYFGDKSVLLHKEYHKLRIYHGGRRRHFDLAIIDPEYASESHWRMQVKQLPYSIHRGASLRCSPSVTIRTHIFALFG